MFVYVYIVYTEVDDHTNVTCANRFARAERGRTRMYSTNSRWMIQTPIVVRIDPDPQCNLSTFLVGGHGGRSHVSVPDHREFVMEA
jgi:hypothetical protein